MTVSRERMLTVPPVNVPAAKSPSVLPNGDFLPLLQRQHVDHVRSAEVTPPQEHSLVVIHPAHLQQSVQQNPTEVELHQTPAYNTIAPEALEKVPRETPRGEHLGASPSRKRKQSAREDPYPIYEVARSKKRPQQQRAIDWLRSDTKDRFDEHYGALFAQWGVKEGHWGTCILSTAQWAALDPIKLASTFAYPNCPEAKSDRLLYRTADHSTFLTRAVAWFADSHWPRNGLELDNFLGAGPFQCMEGSHLCHQHNCIVHVVYETSALNKERKECHKRAQFLRREGRVVPRDCENHSPPCMMQLAALTTYEAYLIQFWILRQAKGLPAIEPPPRPRRHEYNTFEYQLPLLFCGGDSAFQIQDLDCSPPRKSAKPDLICGICKKVRAYKTIIAMWSHIVKKHGDAEDLEPLVREIQRTAHLWKEYWTINPNGGGGRNAKTLKKIEDVESDGFNWDVVLGWNLS